MEITIRCPSGRERDVSISCQTNWRVSELKQHLSQVYPGRPAADTQRIVYAGRLLGNEEPLGQALGQSQAPARVVHLVLPGGACSSPARSISAPAMSMGAGGIREWFHIAVRCALMSLIIFYYSSAGKAISAFAIFFVMQVIQAGFLHRLFVRNPAAAEAAAPPAAAPAEVTEPDAAGAPSESGASQEAPAPAPPQRAATLTETLAAFLDALLTTLVAFITSLVPERPPPLANQ
uniref:Ubiquitin-like domain-containing protein n=1 Tax=Macrostomum lignano TaxID=282301 RepID=A0A1I8IGG7_9PLAT